MREITPNVENTSSQYFPVEQDGKIRCSCGRELVKVDENTWQCSAGFPSYRLDQGDIMLNKFGQLIFRAKGHDKKGQNDAD